MRRLRRVRWGWVALVAPPLLFLGYFFLYPVVRILLIGLAETGAGSTGLQTRLLRVGWFTLWQAIVSTVLTFLAAAPLTWAISVFRFPGRRLAMALVTVPFVLPTVVVGAAFVALGFEDSIGAILAAHVFFNVAVVVRTVSTLWSRIDPALFEAATVLGANARQVFLRVTLPLLRPAIAAAASIVFLFCFTSFGVVLILGGFQYATLEVEIYRQAVTLFDLPLAAALALVQMAGVTLALVAYSRYQRRTTASWTLDAEADRPAPMGAERTLVTVAVAGSLALLAVPVAALFVRSLGSGAYERLFTVDTVVGHPISAVGTSLGYAVLATLVATMIGVMSATIITRGRDRLSNWFDIALMLPLGTSAVTVGFGFIVALDWPVDIRASLLLVPVAHALVAVPFVVRSTVPTMRAIDPATRGAAAVLGASPWRVWRHVELPMVARAALVGAAFSFVISLGEFGATTFIARPGAATIPTMIFRLLSRPGQVNFDMALAMSVVLAILTAAVVLAIDRARLGEIGRF